MSWWACAAASWRRRSSSAACCRASSSALRRASSCLSRSIAASRAFSSAVSFERSSRASASFRWTSAFDVFSVLCVVVSASRLSDASCRFSVVAACCVA